MSQKGPDLESRGKTSNEILQEVLKALSLQNQQGQFSPARGIVLVVVIVGGVFVFVHLLQKQEEPESASFQKSIQEFIISLQE